MSVAARLHAVREQIRVAAEAAGRAPESVTLVAVSKFHPAAAIREAYAAGQRVFGESYVQELEAKATDLADLPDLEWRFIGHLQRNKAKGVVAVGAGVDSVDSIRLARELAKRADRAAAIVPVRIQVDVHGETQKSGVAPAELAALVAEVRELPSLRLEGLMTIPPADDGAAARRSFETLDALATRFDLPVRSMGMSADLELAIACGSTEVRVGTAIFGPRPT
ncbi:MAG: YggS family pyridoxal phosphate-dependent enzyme [Sandaracinus sp.]|nr:YggS family pyridoxal phosphate-dependent enzyme [Sandaracinus sp.]